ncbi:MAG: M42 family metallopeptidase [Elusimicrobia bacterium]|nr:M42 family metallopeptidase [Elusimicrobiota bacterium]
MDKLLKDLLEAPGVSGYEENIAAVISAELEKYCDSVETDSFGNVIGKIGCGGKKIMLATHMDEVGMVVKYINDKGYIYFVKVGGISDGVLLGQRVKILTKNGAVTGIIGTKPPHLMNDAERAKNVPHTDMFIDIGLASRDEVLKTVEIGDQIIFEENAGVLNGDFYFGKAVDNRLGCWVLIKTAEQLSSLKLKDTEIYLVATAQEEVGLKGGKTSSFKIDPDFALIIDTTVAGDVPGIDEKTACLKLGKGVAVTMLEASGRGAIVPSKVRKLILEAARENSIEHQIDIIDGGMTDGAIIYTSRSGVPTGILSIPTRYLHAPSGVFNIKDACSAAELSVKVVQKVSSGTII